MSVKVIKKAIKERVEYIESVIGSLSDTSKMPCYSWNISAKKCIVGSKLRTVEGSVCNKCYAHKGFYMYSNPQIAMEKRYISMVENPEWVNLMSELISLKETSGYFRWFDSGDLQSVQNLMDIVTIALNNPSIKFWLPTKEYGIVSEFLNDNIIPDNLTIRLSAYIIDKDIVSGLMDKMVGCVSSLVSSDSDKANCNAPKQGGKCHDCRKCWNKDISNITYTKH